MFPFPTCGLFLLEVGLTVLSLCWSVTILKSVMFLISDGPKCAFRYVDELLVGGKKLGFESDVEVTSDMFPSWLTLWRLTSDVIMLSLCPSTASRAATCSSKDRCNDPPILAGTTLAGNEHAARLSNKLLLDPLCIVRVCLCLKDNIAFTAAPTRGKVTGLGLHTCLDCCRTGNVLSPDWAIAGGGAMINIVRRLLR